MRNWSSFVPGTELVILLSSAAIPFAASAQTVSGLVRDAETAAGILHARVSLVGPDGVTEAVYTDSAGVFEIPVPASGSYELAVRRIGYVPLLHHPVTIDSAQGRRVVIDLNSAPVMLDPIEVQAQMDDRYLSETGFYRRERVGFGQHYGPEWTERWREGASRTSDILTKLPGLSWNPRGEPGRPRILRILGCGNARYIVDDVRVTGGIDEWILPDEVLAIEVYKRGTETPPQYGTGCIVVIWTRHRSERN